MSRPSVAVDGDGTPWVAYSVMSGDKLEVNVATKDAGGTWVTTTVATSAACNGCPPPRIPRIGVTPDGPIVAWVDLTSDSIKVARLKDGTWTTATVGSGAQADGLALAVGKDGTVFITYYAGNTVMMASSVSSGWTVAKVADATPPPTPSPTPSATPPPSASPRAPLPEPTAGNFEPTTGVAVDDKGKVYVTWSDGDTGTVLLASSG